MTEDWRGATGRYQHAVQDLADARAKLETAEQEVENERRLRREAETERDRAVHGVLERMELGEGLSGEALHQAILSVRRILSRAGISNDLPTVGMAMEAAKRMASAQSALVQCPFGGPCALCHTECLEGKARIRDREATKVPE